jgi:hypothetical protein
LCDEDGSVIEADRPNAGIYSIRRRSPSVAAHQTSANPGAGYCNDSIVPVVDRLIVSLRFHAFLRSPLQQPVHCRCRQRCSERLLRPNLVAPPCRRHFGCLPRLPHTRAERGAGHSRLLGSRPSSQRWRGGAAVYCNPCMRTASHSQAALASDSGQRVHGPSLTCALYHARRAPSSS